MEQQALPTDNGMINQKRIATEVRKVCGCPHPQSCSIYMYAYHVYFTYRAAPGAEGRRLPQTKKTNNDKSETLPKHRPTGHTKQITAQQQRSRSRVNRAVGCLTRYWGCKHTDAGPN